ncbi:hypothetical protein RHSIM_Rhsim10G0015200 [Rhododendron simsii]|uniref:Uncharacterized protein n=1 Tax=Rhododendron simsii TaxID=118357 RepID=A0A834GFX0_RHOSS|nr:hypothetical protein RHSIM_Rhsim10G0015200 [Rhododendron simsii]
MLACRSVRTWAQHGDEIVGIDFGTTNSRLAFMEAQVGLPTLTVTSAPFHIGLFDGVPTLLETESGQAVPSFVAIDSKKKILVGQVARYHAIANPADGLYNMKSLLRRNFHHPEIQELKSKVSFKIIEGPDGEAWVEACNEKFSPTRVCAFVIEKIKKLAELYCMRSISKAVIAAPVYFNDDQKKELQLAAKSAGLDVLAIVDEPIAAALSCKNIDVGTFAIFCLGAGTFNISIIEISDGGVQVKSKEFDTSLGGEDFDIVLVEYLVEEIRKVHSVDISGDQIAMMRLKDGAERAKLELSSSDQAQVNIPYLTGSEHGLVHVDITLARSKFEELVEPLIERIKGLCKRCLEAAHVTEQSIDEVILAGGMANVHRVQQVVQEIFLKSPSMQVKPDEAVAIGALLQCALIVEDRKKLLPHLIPLSLGIETVGGGFKRIICRDSAIPCNRFCDISTSRDNKDRVSIRILQGEHMLASRNKLLGQLEMTGIPRAPRGGVSITLEFCADKNGVLTVFARSKDIEIECSAQFNYMDHIGERYIRMAAKKAILCGRRDIEKLALMQVRSIAEFKLHRIEKVLKGWRNEMPEGDLANYESKLADHKATMGVEDIVLLKAMIASASALEQELLTWHDYGSHDSDSE